MKNDKFIELCHAVELKWTPKKGAVALLSNRPGNVKLRLCSGYVMNTGVMAENCRLWDDGDGSLLYEGTLESVELRKVLTEKGICMAEITDIDTIGKKAGIFMCLGSIQSCKRQACPARSAANAKRAAVQGS